MADMAISGVIFVAQVIQRIMQLIEQQKANNKYMQDIRRRMTSISRIIEMIQALPGDTAKDLEFAVSGLTDTLEEVEKYIVSQIPDKEERTKKSKWFSKTSNVLNADDIKAKLDELDEKLSKYLQVMTAAQGAAQLQKAAALEKQIEKLTQLTSNMFALSLVTQNVQQQRNDMGSMHVSQDQQRMMLQGQGGQSYAGNSGGSGYDTYQAMEAGSGGMARESGRVYSSAPGDALTLQGGAAAAGGAAAGGVGFQGPAGTVARKGAAGQGMLTLVDVDGGGGNSTGPKRKVVRNSVTEAGLSQPLLQHDMMQEGAAGMGSSAGKAGGGAGGMLFPPSSSGSHYLVDPHLYPNSYKVVDEMGMKIAHHMEMAAHQFICGSFVGALALMYDRRDFRAAFMFFTPLAPVATMFLFALLAGQVRAFFAGGLRQFLKTMLTVYKLYGTPCVVGVVVLAFNNSLGDSNTVDIYRTYLGGVLLGMLLFLVSHFVDEPVGAAQHAPAPAPAPRPAHVVPVPAGAAAARLQ